MLTSRCPRCPDVETKKEIVNTMCRETCHHWETQIDVLLESCRENTYCCETPLKITTTALRPWVDLYRDTGEPNVYASSIWDG